MFLIQMVDKFLTQVERVAVVILFTCLIGVIVINILSRNIFQTSVDLLFELMPMMVLWLSLLGASLAMRSERHIKLELIWRFCPPVFKRWAFATTSIFGALVMAILFIASISFFKEELAFFGARGWFSIISPIFFASMTFRYGVRFLSIFSDNSNKRGN